MSSVLYSEMILTREWYAEYTAKLLELDPSPALTLASDVPYNS